MTSIRKLGTAALGAVVGLTTAVTLPLVAASPAAATPPPNPSTCTPDPGYDTCLRFSYTGEPGSYTVPTGVLAIRAKLWGAGGGGGAPQADSQPAAGGGGGFTTATLRTVSGQTFALTVGQGGSPADTSQTFSGGGAGGAGDIDATSGSAGGGMTAIWSDSALGTPLLIAGGGGGAGANTDDNGAFDSPLGGGGGGGNSGLYHATTDVHGGGGGQDAGGVAASSAGASCSVEATAGSQFTGGTGGGGSELGSLGGGGGGGGYYGGGGGACRTSGDGVGSGGAGGGGSAFIAESAVNASTEAGDTSDDATVTSHPGGVDDSLYQDGIGTATGGTDGSPGQLVLEFDSNPVAPAPENVTSTGVGTAAQSPTITVPAGGTLRLLDGSTPVTSLDVPDEGSYSVDTDTNVVTFTPVDGFKGDATPVTFQLTNTSLQTGNATYTPHVDAPPGPTPDPLTSTGTGTAPQTATIAIPNGGSAALLDDSTPTSSLSVTGEGSYSLDSDTGVITFTPVAGFSGDATAITYQVTDIYGTPGSSSYTAHVDAPPGPTPSPLTSTGTGTAPQTATITIPDGGSASLLDGDSETSSLNAPGQGSYALNEATGVVTFTPALGFSGDATAISYQVRDNYGTPGTSSYTPHVDVPAGPNGPTLTSTGRAGAVQHQNVTVPPGGSVKLIDATIGVVGCSVIARGRCGPDLVTSVTAPGKGTYSVVPETGVLTFTPLPNVTGSVSPVGFIITDSYGQQAAGTYQATITPYGRAIASAPALTKLLTRWTTVPVTCKVTAGLIHRCNVTLTYRNGGRVYTVGTGSVLVRGTGSSRPVVVPVRLNDVGHFLALFVGGAQVSAAVSVSQTGNPKALPARTTTRIVNAVVRTSVYFDDSSANVRLWDAWNLIGMRSKLAGVHSVTCVGNTEPGTNAFASWLLGYARAMATCGYLTGGTRVHTTLVSNAWFAPASLDPTPQGQQLNRRTDIIIRY